MYKFLLDCNNSTIAIIFSSRYLGDFGFILTVQIYDRKVGMMQNRLEKVANRKNYIKSKRYIF